MPGQICARALQGRPTFRYFTWHTCLLGIMGCAIMMFLINAIYASASIAFMLLLLLLIHYLSPTSSWGYISQALIFHQDTTIFNTYTTYTTTYANFNTNATDTTFNTLSKNTTYTTYIVYTTTFNTLHVRKYLLMLDVRKDHVKFWRPQVLLMVSNPRTAVGLISFINDIKKSGLYVLGHVQLGELNTLPSDPLQSQYDSWLSLVDHLNIKAFVNLTLATSVRHGVQHLLFISGLGGMRPNTLVLGFYDNNPPEDKLLGLVLSSSGPRDPEDQQQQKPFHFPSLRGDAATEKSMDPQEYVAVIADAIKMLKNVALARYFHDFQRTRALLPAEKGAGVYVDVWPVNLLRPDSSSYVDTCSLFLLQLACILNMVRAWRRARLRLFLCVEEGRSLRGTKEKLGQLLKELRIKATVYTVPWDSQVALHWQRQSRAEKRPLDPAQEQPEQEEDNLEEPEVEEEEEEYVNSFPSNGARLSDNYLLAVNRLILDQPCLSPAVRFLYLPRPPADTRRYTTYLRQLDLLTLNLGPTLLIHGVTPVLTTDL
ncbi:unnamed protein product [Boreogadus saida]